MVRNKYSVRKYLASTAIVTAVVFSSMVASDVSAYGGPETEANSNNPPVTEEKQVKETKQTKSHTSILRKGSRGEAVKTVQSKLGVNADSIFGKNTENAVKKIQSDKGLTVDGIVGPKTNEVLSVPESKPEKSEDEQVEKVEADKNDSILRKGSRGEAVKAAQSSLGVNADGVFGQNTENAVKSLQSNNGLTVDGVVGPATKEVLSTAQTETVRNEVVKEEAKEVAVEEVTQTSTAPVASASTGNQSDVESVARELIGSSYVAGGTTPAGFDSSGFINYAFDQVGVSLDRTHTSMWVNNGRHVNSPSVGDVVFFENTYKPGVSHSGIYIGNNQMIHAGTSATGVEVTSMGYDYWQDRYIGAKSF